MKQLIIIAFLLPVLFSSCQKKDSTTPDAAQVTISVTSPVAEQQFRSGDTVFINATVSYPSELHGYEVKITDSATGNILYDDAQHIHDDHFVINDKWVCTDTHELALRLELTTEVDHNGTEATKTVNFSYKP